jgi:D-alanine-D-alanine ligase
MAGHCEEVVAIPFGPSLVDDLRHAAPDLAFNIAEGREGPSRESIVPAVLDHLGIRYTGSDGVCLGISLNKALTKQLAAGIGIPTPGFRLCRSGDEADDAARDLRFPVLAKPNFGGSSAGISRESVVGDPSQLRAVVEAQIAGFGQPSLVEEFVRGVDVTVGLLGNGEIEAFPAARIEAAGGLYSAEAKQRHEKRVVCPCDLPAGLEDELAGQSRAIYELIGARDFARVDFMMDGDGNAHFLEINPLPGLSPYYGVYPVLAAAAGYSHTDLIGTIMELANGRYADAVLCQRMAE